jgi:outer membrane lipoprotein-sorting protein
MFDFPLYGSWRLRNHPNLNMPKSVAAKVSSQPPQISRLNLNWHSSPQRIKLAAGWRRFAGRAFSRKQASTHARLVFVPNILFEWTIHRNRQRENVEETLKMINVTHKNLAWTFGRSFRILAAILATAALMPPSARAQTVDEIIAKNVQALGGIQKLQSVQTLRSQGKLDAGFFRADIVQQVKRPDKIRQEFTVQGLTQVQAYDGKTGWQINPFGGRRDPEMLSQDDTKGLQVDADMDGPLVNYKEKGNKAEFVGHDSVEGTDCYKIKLTLKNGDVRTYYFDADSYLEIKLETQTMVRGAMQESEAYYGDYEQVGGIYYPFAYEVGQKGDPNRAKFTVEKIEQNTPLDDSVFTLPVAKPAGGVK